MSAGEAPNPVAPVTPGAMLLELVILPVADIDRAKAFYRDRVGFTVDVDVAPAEGEAVRAGLVARGVDVAPVVDRGGVLYAGFSDPDGNTWMLQHMPWRA